MSLKANYEILFVGRDESSFLESYTYDLFEDHGEKSGQIFINLEVQNNPVDAEEIGQAIFETMQGVFFEDLTMDGYERFEHALKSVNEVLDKFKSEKVSNYIGNLNIVVAAIVGNQLYLTQAGDAEAYLIRKRFVSVVSDGLSDENEEGEVFSSIASGEIEAGDFVMFSTTRLLRYISKTDLAACVNKSSIIESLDDVKDIISTEILGRVGMTGILFEKLTAADENQLDMEVDSVRREAMEATQGRISVKKEGMAGRFFAMAKKAKNRASSSRINLGPLSKWVSNFSASLFSKGFGKDKFLAILIVIIAVLLIGIFFASGRQAKQEEIERLDGILQNVQDQISEAETKSAFDKEVAKGILDQAYMDAKSVLDSGIYREKATLLLVEIDEARDRLDNVQRIETPLVSVDLTSANPNISALGFANVGDRTYVYDVDHLYEVVVDQIQDPLNIDDEETIVAATGFDDRGSVVFLTQSGNMIEYRDGTMTFMDTDDGSFRKGASITDWSNRIYMLDPAGGNIWKYTYLGTRDRFAEAEEYILDETDVSAARDLAIDGNVYTLDANGDINKFYAGTKVDFFIDNPPFGSLQDPRVIYTNERLDEVFVLDSGENKVVVYLKDSRTGNLVYQSQYLFDNVDELRDLYVDEETRTLFVLTATKIIELSL